MRYVELMENKLDQEYWGSWIDTNNKKIYPVTRASHGSFIKEKYPKLKRLSDIQALSIVIGDGWVRVLHDPDDNYIIGLTGLPEPLKIAWNLIKRDVLKDYLILYVSVLKPEKSEWRVHSDKEFGFDIPNNAEKIINFFNTL